MVMLARAMKAEACSSVFVFNEAVDGPVLGSCWMCFLSSFGWLIWVCDS